MQDVLTVSFLVPHEPLAPSWAAQYAGPSAVTVTVRCVGRGWASRQYLQWVLTVGLVLCQLRHWDKAAQLCIMYIRQGCCFNNMLTTGLTRHVPSVLLCPPPLLQGSNGATLYDYEYDLDSTRGKKRIFNTVTITGTLRHRTLSAEGPAQQ